MSTSEVGAEFLASYLTRLQAAISELDPMSLLRLAEAIDRTVAEGRQVLLLGNGGSAATAGHYVNDLVMAYGRTGRVARVRSLTDNPALITGIGNDYSFAEIFTFQLRASGGPGDLAIAISASGNSPNLLAGIEQAQALGMTTAAIVGFDGGRLAELCDIVVHAATGVGDYGPAEDLHLIVNHAIAGLLYARGVAATS
ncbi:MAG: SIS domain-containing protein [Actinomycetales bacterium]|nr:SIS domain-containing protein [Actinomycetales bacterium]